MTTRATLYIESTVLSFPGTASVEWRAEVASALDLARTWFSLSVVLVGRTSLDPLMHQALHELNADRAVFGGARGLETAYTSAVQGDHSDHPASQIWLLSTSLRGRIPPPARDAIDKLGLRSTVRLLPARSDVVTPLVADDLVEVFAAYARTREER